MQHHLFSIYSVFIIVAFFSWNIYLIEYFSLNFKAFVRYTTMPRAKRTLSEADPNARVSRAKKSSKELTAKEIIAEELPAKKIPAKELSTKELPTKELPTNKLPTKKIPAKELPTKAITAKELPVKELPAKTPRSETGHKLAKSSVGLIKCTNPAKG